MGFLSRPGPFPPDNDVELLVKVVRRRKDTGLRYGEVGTKTFRSLKDAAWFIEQAKRSDMEVRVYRARVVWTREDA